MGARRRRGGRTRGQHGARRVSRWPKVGLRPVARRAGALRSAAARRALRAQYAYPSASHPGQGDAKDAWQAGL